MKPITEEYIKRLNIPIEGSPNRVFKTKEGTLIATGYSRIVIGGRGPYIEFTDEHICKNNLYVPEKAKWRFNKDRYKNICYHEYRSKDNAFVKVYYQLKTVDYADYRVNCWYISPFDLVDGNMNCLIKRKGQ